MKCYSIQKEDDFVTVCVLCTLSFFWKSWLLSPDIIAVESLMPVHATSGFFFLFERGDTEEEVFCWCIIPDFIIPVSLNCKYLENPALCGPVSLSNSSSLSFPSGSCVLQSFWPTLHLPCLSSLSGCVSNIVQCSTLGEFDFKLKKIKRGDF